MNYNVIFLTLLVLLTAFSCNKEEINDDQDPIVGRWFLVAINDIDVERLECYEDSYLESNGTRITFYILDRLADGTCESLLDSSSDLTNEEGFYYLGDEVIEIYIDGNELTWRVDRDTTLIFEKS